ncbi:MAG TPA: DUF1778 domain-containing protein [Parvularculaceae bacterium]|nr:DUF1778 domain-containing protein [Parvularculaceae bacterium]
MPQQTSKARFDAQLPVDQKAFFEEAMALGGYRSLTEFILTSAQEKAAEIIDRHKTLLTSEHDRKVFFDALLKPPAPNAKLRRAAKRHEAAVAAR